MRFSLVTCSAVAELSPHDSRRTPGGWLSRTIGNLNNLAFRSRGSSHLARACVDAGHGRKTVGAIRVKEV